jgi:spore coat polysaccharide biosynthesis predicted glycosyltransferase SpsG
MCYWIPASAGMTTNELIRVSLSVLVSQVGNTAITAAQHHAIGLDVAYHFDRTVVDRLA